VRFSNELSVGMPVDAVWDVLLDVERVAGYLPGAMAAPVGSEPGTYRGEMRVKLGPVVVRYGGTLRIQDADEAARVAVLAIEAAEVGGQGTARATITNRLRPANGGTLVLVETELDVTGRQAQLGHAIMGRVADRMLADFARRFEADLGAGDAPAGDVLDLGSAVSVQRAAIATLSAAVVVMAVRVIRRLR
jgi:uncharacterized protein